MLTTQLGELLAHLWAGIFDPADAAALEHTSAKDFLAELESLYFFRVQERRLNDKWEIGIARTVCHEFDFHTLHVSLFTVHRIVLIFRNCLFVAGEGDAVTGVSATTQLRVKPIRKPIQGLALSIDRGFKLDKLPDGWSLKPIEKRTVKLSEDLLRNRGWCINNAIASP